MSGIERAEQAVAEARARLVAYLCQAGLSTPRAEANLDTLVRAVEARCYAYALDELLTDNTGDPTDEAYNRGVRHAARATQEQP